MGIRLGNEYASNAQFVIVFALLGIGMVYFGRKGILADDDTDKKRFAFFAAALSLCFTGVLSAHC